MAWRRRHRYGGVKRYLIESIGLNAQLDVALEGSGGRERMNGQGYSRGGSCFLSQRTEKANQVMNRVRTRTFSAVGASGEFKHRC